jgi:hypothetical protein
MREGGTSRTYALRRLAKDCPELHAQCLAGELTAHAAMVQAGFRTRPPSRKRTPLDYLHRYWRQVSAEERLRFLCEMLTPTVLEELADQPEMPEQDKARAHQLMVWLQEQEDA